MKSPETRSCKSHPRWQKQVLWMIVRFVRKRWSSQPQGRQESIENRLAKVSKKSKPDYQGSKQNCQPRLVGTGKSREIISNDEDKTDSGRIEESHRVIPIYRERKLQGNFWQQKWKYSNRLGKFRETPGSVSWNRHRWKPNRKNWWKAILSAGNYLTNPDLSEKEKAEVKPAMVVSKPIPVRKQKAAVPETE